LHALGIGKKICILLVLHLLFPWLLLAISLEEYKGIYPPPSFIIVFVEKAIAKVARRSKRAYTLLDFTLLGLLAQGSKRAYTP
jgi:hypothetical protein